jgi:hypothetical protein
VSTPRVEDVERVEVGRWYMVPTCFYPYYSRLQPWPVIGPRHEDGEWIGYPHQHFHVDGRFLDDRTWSWLGRRAWQRVRDSAFFLDEHKPHAAEITVALQPLMILGRDHPEPVWRRRRCARDFRHTGGVRSNPFPRLVAHFKGAQCLKRDGAWVCPHKGARLTMPPEPGDVIVCPLHGLRIDPATGIVRAA